MSERDAWDALQTRWSRGDELTPEEQRARLSAAETDPLARRELELFAELENALREPNGDAPNARTSPNVALTLAGARGVKLKLLGPDSALPADSSNRSTRRLAAGLGAGATLLAAAGAALYFGSRAKAPPAEVRAPAAPVERAVVAIAARSELVFASGEVMLGDRRAVIGKQTLSAGATVTTGAGRACLTIDPGIDVCLDEKSELSLESLSGTRVSVRVKRGTAVASLSPRPAGHHFALLGGDVVATARGTVFALEVAPASARVTVVEGNVAVRHAGDRETLVPAHASLDARGAAPSAVGRTDEARLHALLSPRKLWQGTNLGVLEIGAAEPGERVMIDELGPFELPLGSLVSTGRHRVSLRSGNADSGADVDIEAGASRRLFASDLGDASTAAAPTASALLGQARKKLSAGDPRGALALYRELRRVYPKSSEATAVLVTLGKLELDLGAPERALSAFDAYVEHGGSLVPEALSGRIRALRALGRTEEERRAIEAYLARYPKGFDAPALKTRLAKLSGG